jgi:hypothetical protein
MIRITICTLFAVAIAVASFGQDLDTASFVDQIDSGQRGGNSDDGPTGTFDGDWSFELLTDGTAGLSGADVNYLNVFAAEASQGAGEIESPVVDVTSSSNINPDRAWTIPAIAANSRPGATSPSNAVLVGDDGGYNALAFGEWDDRHYDVKVDVFLPNHVGSLDNANNEFVRLGLAVRCQQDPTDNTNEEVTIDGAAWITRPQGCYCLLYDSSEGVVYPVKILQQLPDATTWDDIRDLSLTNADNADPQVAEFLGSGWSVTEGWHTFGIRASLSEITFSVDENTPLVVNDSTYPAGKVAVMYRTNSSTVGTQTYDHGGRFDQIRSEPAPPLEALGIWQMYP